MSDVGSLLVHPLLQAVSEEDREKAVSLSLGDASLILNWKCTGCNDNIYSRMVGDAVHRAGLCDGCYETKLLPMPTLKIDIPDFDPIWKQLTMSRQLAAVVNESECVPILAAVGLSNEAALRVSVDAEVIRAHFAADRGPPRWLLFYDPAWSEYKHCHTQDPFYRRTSRCFL
jgi:hypothetical protein